MALGESGELSGPPPRYVRVESPAGDDTLMRALRLARQIEELLEETRSRTGAAVAHDPSAHSTGMARAIAASLVDELEVLVRPDRQSSVA